MSNDDIIFGKMKFNQLIVVIGIILVYIPSEAASFDCTKAKTTLEKTICNDSRLDDADNRLGKVYSQLKKSLSKPEANH